MQVNLTASNFFKYYMFNRDAPELSPRDRQIAKVAFVALCVFTVGIVPLFTYAFIYDRNFKPNFQPGGNLPVPNPVKPGINPGQAPVPPVAAKIVVQGPQETKVRFGNIDIEVKVVQDICSLSHDAIVNAANVWLAAGNGVCGAIHQQGGNGIFQECAAYLQGLKVAQVEEGHAMITGGGNLQAKHVIHAVGPTWKGNDEIGDKQKLYNAYYNSLLRSHENNLKSIAFPSISTGIFHFPLEKAGPIAIQAFTDFAAKNPNSSVKTITMALWANTCQFYSSALLDKANAVQQKAAVVLPKANAAPNDLLLPFYRGEGRDSEGRLLKDIWAMNDRQKSDGHDFIQWLFPNTKPSEHNKNAPVLNRELIAAMKGDPVIVANVRTSFTSMLSYYGLNFDEAQKKVVAAANFEERKREWFQSGDHNFLRITRILSCLKTMGLKDEARSFYDHLTLMNNKQPNVFRKSYTIWSQIIAGI